MFILTGKGNDRLAHNKITEALAFSGKKLAKMNHTEWCSMLEHLEESMHPELRQERRTIGSLQSDMKRVKHNQKASSSTSYTSNKHSAAYVMMDCNGKIKI